MTTHTLKTNQVYFDAVKKGTKTFEARRNDRGFQKGDRLILLPEDYCQCANADCLLNRDKPTPLRRRVTYVFAGDPSLQDNGGIVPGYVVLGLGSWSE